MNDRYRCAFAVVLGLLAGSAFAQTPVTTAFTYQGRLDSGGTPVTGAHNFEFSLWDAVSNGNQLGTTQSINNVVVNGGLFTVTLNNAGQFSGFAFDGDARWLQIKVDSTTLSPRQPLTATPYASAVRGLKVGPALLNDQSQPLSTAIEPGTVWQSFTAGLTGDLTALDVGTQNSVAFQTTVNIYQGTGTGGTQLVQDQIISVTDGQEFAHVVFDNPPAVTAGQVYTFAINTSVFAAWSINHSNPYAGGTANTAAGDDLVFRTYVTVADAGFIIDRDVALDGLLSVSGTLDVGQNATFGGSLTTVGKLGVGTTGPGMSLEVRGPNTYYGKPSAGVSSGNNWIYINGGADPAVIWNSPGSLRFGSESSRGLSFAERMRITATGSVGIGTTTPNEKLHVIGNIRASGSVFASCGTLSCSDQRFKTNVSPMHSALDTIARLQAVHFDWRTSEFPDRKFGDGRQIGFIAQQVQGVLPQIVQSDSEGFLSVDYGRLTPVLVAGMQELRAEKDGQIAELKAENAELRAQLARLTAQVAEISGRGESKGR